jgi:hypothetical protein
MNIVLNRRGGAPSGAARCPSYVGVWGRQHCSGTGKCVPGYLLGGPGGRVIEYRGIFAVRDTGANVSFRVHCVHAGFCPALPVPHTPPVQVHLRPKRCSGLTAGRADVYLVSAPAGSVKSIYLMESRFYRVRPIRNSDEHGCPALSYVPDGESTLQWQNEQICPSGRWLQCLICSTPASLR